MRKATKLKQDNLKRSKILSKLFASLFMSVGAVIIIVAFVPKSPVASIDEIQVFKDTLTYQVSVTDENHAIIDNSLVVILENQFTSLSSNISTGSSIGIFESLSPDTIYSIKVMANIGFGMELLAKETFETEERMGGMIYNNSMLSSVDDYQLNYQVSTYISDPYDEITNTYLKLSYFSVGYSYQQTPHVSTMPVNEGFSELIVDGLYNENLQVTYQLIGTINYEEVVLDTYLFYTPVEIYAECYPVQILSDAIHVGIYGQSITTYQTQYRVLLYEGERLLKSLPYTIPQEFMEPMGEESRGLWIDGLVNNHQYRIEFWVFYKDPSSFNDIGYMVNDFEFQTPHLASYTYQVSHHDTYIEVMITGDDPYSVYQNAGYVIYNDEDGMYFYYFMSFQSLVLENGVMTTTFIIDKDITLNQVFSVYVFNEEQNEISIYLAEYEPL